MELFTENQSSFSIDLGLLEKEIEKREKSKSSSPICSTEIDSFSELNTLDEPLWNTIDRDLKVVKEKLTLVLLPNSKKNILSDWDLWCPLFIYVFLSLSLQGNNKGPQFTQVFSLAFLGSFAVTLNIKLLGGKISFVQTLCLIGYCLLPCLFSSVFIKIIYYLSSNMTIQILARIILTLVGFVWAIYASQKFLTGTQNGHRKNLGHYPLFLFYIVVSWLVITNA